MSCSLIARVYYTLLQSSSLISVMIIYSHVTLLARCHFKLLASVLRALPSLISYHTTSNPSFGAMISFSSSFSIKSLELAGYKRVHSALLINQSMPWSLNRLILPGRLKNHPSPGLTIRDGFSLVSISSQSSTAFLGMDCIVSRERLVAVDHHQIELVEEMSGSAGVERGVWNVRR